jgi:hypothetical protein
MPDAFDEHTPPAPQHTPSPIEWVSFLLSVVLLIGLFYVMEAYAVYRDDTVASRLPAANTLEGRQKSTSPDSTASIEAWVQQQLDDEDSEDYRVDIPSGRAGGIPFVLLCDQRCVHSIRSVKMQLAYGLHYDRSGGSDNWDFWFAPVEQGTWVSDPTRFLYRINPSQNDHWGLVDGNWTDLNVAFSENKIAGIPNLADTPLSDYLHQIVATQNVQAANVIRAPIDSLTIHRSFANGALFEPPGWRAIGTWLEGIRAGLPGFLSEASSDRSLAQWLGENWDGLLWLLGILSVGLVYAVKGWWAVGVYGFYWFTDEREKERRDE